MHGKIIPGFRVYAKLSAAIAGSGASSLAFAAGAAGEGPAVLGIPVEFILFALTLVGVAVLHHYTLQVALAGLAVITAYKLGFTGFKTGPGFEGFLWHM